MDTHIKQKHKENGNSGDKSKPILQPDSNVFIVIVTMLGKLLCKSMKKTVNLLVNSNVPIVNVNSQRNQI